jgi:hypothetical protein
MLNRTNHICSTQKRVLLLRETLFFVHILTIGGSIYLLLILSNLNRKNEINPEKMPAPTEIIILVIMLISE